MGKTTEAVPHGAHPDDIPGAEPEVLPEATQAMPGAITRLPGRSHAQRLLDRLLAVRTELLTAALSQDKSLSTMRKAAKKPEAGLGFQPRPPETTFFEALEQLAGDFEAAAKRFTEQAQELRERF